MSTPQKSLFSLLSLCQKISQSVEIWRSSDKKISLHSFLRHCVYSHASSSATRRHPRSSKVPPTDCFGHDPTQRNPKPVHNIFPQWNTEHNAAENQVCQKNLNLALTWFKAKVDTSYSRSCMVCDFKKANNGNFHSCHGNTALSIASRGKNRAYDSTQQLRRIGVGGVNTIRN